jgi:hypothetical protein
MAAASASADWISYCRSNRGDNGTIEALFNLHDDDLADISKGHCNNVEAFGSTIANSGGGNFLLIPGSKGTVHLICVCHHLRRSYNFGVHPRKV